MFETYEFSVRVPRARLNRLSLCLVAVLASQMSSGAALTSPSVAPARPAGEHRGIPAKNIPDHPAASPWTVKNCTDHNTDSLRDIIQNKAQSGDTVDLSQLPMLCSATDSKITLTTGEIAVAQDNLTLQGPDPATGTVTISGGGALRVLDHQGFGTLSVKSLTITEGYYHVAGSAYGGCLKSQGSVDLNAAQVTNCVASSDVANARGGGIFARANVNLVHSNVSGNQAMTASSQTAILGGGIYAFGNLSAKYSSISANAALGVFSTGGGAYVHNTISVLASTIDNNTASALSAIVARGAVSVSNSTISGNVASVYDIALFTDGDYLTISNSTIAFNHSNLTGSGAISFKGPSANSPFTLQSSIIADNTAGAANTPSDVYVTSGHGVLSGADNLVIASNVSPPDVITVTSDPKLGPLQFNGGLTRTHQLLAGSPALGMGNVNGLPASITTDQRGTNYPRTTGANASVDIGAVQFDTIFVAGFDLQ